jgi:hypothetical protein
MLLPMKIHPPKFGIPKGRSMANCFFCGHATYMLFRGGKGRNGWCFIALGHRISSLEWHLLPPGSPEFDKSGTMTRCIARFHSVGLAVTTAIGLRPDLALQIHNLRRQHRRRTRLVNSHLDRTRPDCPQVDSMSREASGLNGLHHKLVAETVTREVGIGTRGTRHKRKTRSGRDLRTERISGTSNDKALLAISDKSPIDRTVCVDSAREVHKEPSWY